MYIALALTLLFDFTPARSDEGEQRQIICTGKVVDDQGRAVEGAKISLYKLTLSMELLSLDVELAQSTTTKDDGTFTFETLAEESNERNQAIILVDKE